MHSSIFQEVIMSKHNECSFLETLILCQRVYYKFFYDILFPFNFFTAPIFLAFNLVVDNGSFVFKLRPIIISAGDNPVPHKGLFLKFNNPK